PFEEIKTTTVMAAARLEKKLDILKNKADEIRKSISGNLETTKNLYPDLKIESADSVTVNRPDPKIGSDPAFTNALFKLSNGQISEPIRTQRGYYIVQIRSITPFDQNSYQQEYAKIRDELIAQKKQTITQEWINDLKEKAEIVDNRDKFYR
ncbi:MAG: peptidyl-prolyl cis-trans isomerase, partial [Ignavibacteria bacterium]|nr:peptidyl-prolyl cis-trans isomerase [Ignavibacteria bacterium]